MAGSGLGLARGTGMASVQRLRAGPVCGLGLAAPWRVGMTPRGWGGGDAVTPGGLGWYVGPFYAPVFSRCRNQRPSAGLILITFGSRVPLAPKAKLGTEIPI